jgi:CMP-N,N'-diacetyllegionaminic acid synthase
MSLVALIPARGGSKGIPRKNLALMAGRPLMEYTISAARESGVIDRLVCSSDDDEIITYCRRMSVDVIRRPSHLATDDTAMSPVIAHALEELRRETGVLPKWLLLLQPTSPLRTADDMRAAYRLLDGDRVRTVISVTGPVFAPYKAFVGDAQGFIHGLVNDDAPFMRRQDCPPVYLANGAIYIFSSEDFLRRGRIELDRAVPYLMPTDRSIDIDNPADLKDVEDMLR